jgi:peptidoglycan-associated lipoprotein
VFERDGSGLSPSDTVVSTEDCCDENFIGNGSRFIAHGFDDKKTEHSYTAADVLESLYFTFDSAKISAVEFAKVDDVAKIFAKDKSLNVLIVGNCDKFGAEKYNYSLGRRRAKAVRDVFISVGIKSDRIVTASLGSYKANKNARSREDGAHDRRCDVVLHRACD